MKEDIVKIISIIILLIFGILGLITERDLIIGEKLIIEINNGEAQKTGETEEVKEIEKIREGFNKVLKVVDGDTIAINLNGEKKTVRLIGIDSPETVHPTKPVQCFGIEASNKAKEVLENQIIRLEFDETQGEQDKYGRMLAYVFLEDGTNFNEYMIQNGYAYEYTYGEAYKYQNDFKLAQKEAEEKKVGLWAKGVCSR